MAKRKKPDVYMLLTHAIWHCQWGDGPIDREADEADLQAAKILTDIRNEVTRETTD